MNDETRNREPEPDGEPVGTPNPGTARRRAYTQALRAAYRLAGVGPAGLLYTTDDIGDLLTAGAQPEVGGDAERSRDRPRRGHSLQRAPIMELYVAKVDVSAHPMLSIVPAHATIRIKADLRSEGHDLG